MSPPFLACISRQSAADALKVLTGGGPRHFLGVYLDRIDALCIFKGHEMFRGHFGIDRGAKNDLEDFWLDLLDFLEFAMSVDEMREGTEQRKSGGPATIYIPGPVSHGRQGTGHITLACLKETASRGHDMLCTVTGMKAHQI